MHETPIEDLLSWANSYDRILDLWCRLYSNEILFFRLIGRTEQPNRQTSTDLYLLNVTSYYVGKTYVIETYWLFNLPFFWAQRKQFSPQETELKCVKHDVVLEKCLKFYSECLRFSFSWHKMYLCRKAQRFPVLSKGRSKLLFLMPKFWSQAHRPLSDL